VRQRAQRDETYKLAKNDAHHQGVAAHEPAEFVGAHSLPEGVEDAKEAVDTRISSPGNVFILYFPIRKQTGSKKKWMGEKGAKRKKNQTGSQLD